MRDRSPFTTVRSEGGLLPVELLSRLAQQPDSLPGTTPADYHLPSGWRLRDAINRSWTELQGAWATFATELAQLGSGERATTLTRERWLLPLFAELGYGRLARTPALSVDGHDYPVSHIWGPLPVHLLGADVDLDRRTKGVAGAAGASPHSMVQDLLNRSDRHLWAIISNGRTLRVLRDNTSLTRAAYVEFDLEDMFTGQVFADFVVLWMLCQQSRFDAERPELCWEEIWVSESKRQGVRALDSLRTGFERAITALGGGFLAHPTNEALRTELRSGALTNEDYHRQILRLVYRLVFLLVAEDRDLLHPEGTTDQARALYARYYSVGRLRDHARRHGGTRHHDLWESVKPVFAALGQRGIPSAAVPALGSFLWSAGACSNLDTSHLANRDLLTAVRQLAYTQRDGALHRVDFTNLGPEELGSVYESLLELHPRVEVGPGRFELVNVSGNERKSTGSYYTPSSLITALLDLALDPLLDEAEASASPKEAILSLKVLDPACGSGHFLTAAARRIAIRLASIESGELNPPPYAVRHALRRVVGRCIYGIDLNPMAAELAKVNLWLDAVDPGLPLSFLDHHVVCGNGVVGSNPRLIAEGIPDEAFKAFEGDDKATTNARKKANATERAHRSQGLLALGTSPLAFSGHMAEAFRLIDAEDDRTIDGVGRKQQLFEELQREHEARLAKLTADAWCAAFFAPKTLDQPAITDRTLRSIEQNHAEDRGAIELIVSLAEHHHFLHPHIAFPDVFAPDPEAEYGWQGGFDLVFGNPPWDTLSPDRKEFFSSYDPQVRFVPKSQQEAIIAELLQFPEFAKRWEDYQRDLYTSVHFMKSSGRYRLFAPGNLGKGDFNIYRMFVETAMQLTRQGGRAAQVLPAGFYGGANAASIRREFYEHWQLSHVFGFINTTGAWFPEVHRDTQFCLYAGTKGRAGDGLTVAFGLRSSGDLAQALAGGAPRLSVADIYQQSPTTLAIPETTNASDAAVATRMSRWWPFFGDETIGPPVRHFQREVDMGTDRDLFGAFPEGLPVYEGRMVEQFDHRAKAYRSGRGRSAVWEEIAFSDSGKAIVPQWRLPPENIPSKLGDRVWRYRVGWCDVTGARNERSLLAALIPPSVICGHSLPTFVFREGWEWAYLPWLAVANSFCLDFLVRKRIALHVSMVVLDGLPFPRLPVEHPVVERLARLALRLTCTAAEMTAYWNSMVPYGWCDPIPEDATPPGYLDPETRAAARAEMDAVVARYLFDLSVEELASILDTFMVLRRREEKVYGEFRTKRLVLDWYDKV